MNDRRNIDIMESKLAIFTRDGWQCQYVDEHGHQCPVCGAFDMFEAHRIGQGKRERKWVRQAAQILFDVPHLTERDVDQIIYHPFNMVTSCIKHNDSFNIGCKPIERKQLLVKIWEDLHG